MAIKGRKFSKLNEAWDLGDNLDDAECFIPDDPDGTLFR